jgi:glycosyltransferase involved in cell wall biosynthesis
MAELSPKAEELNAQHLQSAERIQALTQALEEKDHRVAEINREVDELKCRVHQSAGRCAELKQALTQANGVIDAMRDSTSWRMTSFFRWCSTLARRFGPLRIIRASASSRNGSNAFRSLPLSEGSRTAIKSAVFRRMGWLFKGSLSYRAWQAREFSAASAPELTEDFRVDPGSGAADETMDDGDVDGIKRILVIDYTTPQPDCDAGSVTAYFFLKAFVELGYQVTFIPDDLNYSEKYTGKLRELGVRCFTSREIDSVENFLKQRGRSIDIVVLYRVHTATRHLPAVKQYAPQAKIIFDTVDLHYLREERQACVSQCGESIKQAAHTKKLELEMIRAADTTIVLSTKERELLLQENAELNIVNIPLLLEIPGSRNAFERRDGIVFIGGFLHQPNIDGVCYFVRNIWPIVSTALPDVKFQVIGSNVPEDVLALGSAPNVEVLGFVENLDSVFDTCRLSVVPLRYGAGIKGKIGTSASYGVPCVSTIIGIEGMELRDGIEVLVADDPQRFAEQVVRLYTDKLLWERMSESSLSMVKERYSYEKGRELLRQLLSKYN